MATTSSTSTALFNGNSRYSTDFQAVIDRTVAIASLPITQLNSEKTRLSDQTDSLSAIGGRFDSLQNALDKITAAVGGSSFDASVSDSSKISVTLSDRAAEGNYSVQVVDAGAYASSLTASNWTAASGGPHPYKVSIAGVLRDLFAYDNTAAGVANAVNSQFGDQVRAVVVNVGSTQTPDYRISLQATRLGDLTPDLLDGTTSLQASRPPAPWPATS